CRAHAADGAVCAACAAALPLAEPACPQCAAPSSTGGVCGRCLAHPPRFDAVSAGFAYAWPADALVQAFKYGGNHAAGRFLARALAARARERPDLVVPIPLAPGRLAERGFNQAVELARTVCHVHGYRLAAHACRRVRETPSLTHMAHAERAQSIRDAFVCDANVAGRTVAVVDDVVTTGATLNELARMLKRAGAARVIGWVAARTP
ncbi:MAG: ComF family protein, partial [Burkholderiales bacterium]